MPGTRMAHVLIVADDVTGANASGSLFAEAGMRAATLWRAEDLQTVGEHFDVVALSIGSRSVSSGEARRRVRHAVRAHPGARLVVKRIDTTLRGNVGAEIEAALDALRDVHGGDVRAVVVPAFPAAGRTCSGGIQHLDGVPVAETPAGRDPLAPVTSSRVAEIIGTGCSLPIAEAHTDELGDDDLERALCGAEVVVCDASHDADLDRIARAARRVARRAGVRFLSADSGPFGPRLALALGLAADAAGPPRVAARPGRGPLVIVAGSATHATSEQLAAAEHQLGARLTWLGGDLAGALARAGDGAIVGVRTPQKRDDRTELHQRRARDLLESLAATVARALGERPIGGLYTTGGDVTHAVTRALGAAGIEVLGEILPLAVRGRLLGGPRNGLPIVTKGGLVGGRDAAVVCLRSLRVATEAKE